MVLLKFMCITDIDSYDAKCQGYTILSTISQSGLCKSFLMLPVIMTTASTIGNTDVYEMDIFEGLII